MDCKFGEDEYFCEQSIERHYNTFYKNMFEKKVLTNFTCLLQYTSDEYLLTKTNPPFNSLKFCDSKLKCKQGEIKCNMHNYCIKIDQICDGIKNCMEGDDEVACGRKKKLKFNRL